MENITKLLTNWQLHPFVDHFTIALLVVGVLVDVSALIFSQRLWLRYMALTLMILGAACAAASFGTGRLEGDRVWKLITNPKAKDVLKEHALYGRYLTYVFAGLAVWRILIQAFAFMDRTRQIYLALAVVAVGFLLYQGRLGGQLVYTYGVGTGAMEAGAAQVPAVEAVTPQTAAPEATAAPAVPAPLPTVYNPTAEPTAAPPTEAPSATPAATPEAPATASPENSAAPEPSAKPTV